MSIFLLLTGVSERSLVLSLCRGPTLWGCEVLEGISQPIKRILDGVLTHLWTIPTAISSNWSRKEFQEGSSTVTKTWRVSARSLCSRHIQIRCRENLAMLGVCTRPYSPSLTQRVTDKADIEKSPNSYHVVRSCARLSHPSYIRIQSDSQPRRIHNSCTRDIIPRRWTAARPVSSNSEQVISNTSQVRYPLSFTVSVQFTWRVSRKVWSVSFVKPVMLLSVISTMPLLNPSKKETSQTLCVSLWNSSLGCTHVSSDSEFLRFSISRLRGRRQVAPR